VLKQVVADLVVGELVATTPWLKRLSWLGYRVAPVVLLGRTLRQKFAQAAAKRKGKQKQASEYDAFDPFDPHAIPW
jgi:hypothetical protein